MELASSHALYSCPGTTKAGQTEELQIQGDHTETDISYTAGEDS